MADIINLRRARKDKARAEGEAHAAANRSRFGRKRAERDSAEAEKRLADRHLDGHRLNEAPEARRDENEESGRQAFDRDRGS
jgi:hypothetical protein